MTSSHQSDRKPPPGPVKVHHFEKKQVRPKGTAEWRQYEDASHSRPTLLELSLEPRKGGAAAEKPPEAPARKKERSASAKGTPKSPAKEPTKPPAKEPRGSGKRSSSEEESSGGDSASGVVAKRLATAQRHVKQGELEPARVILEKLVAQGVVGAAAHSLLGTVYMAQGFLDRALASFEEALTRDPGDLSARLRRGEVRMEWGDLMLAQQDFQYVLDAGTTGSPLVQQAWDLLQELEAQRGRRRR